MTLIEIRSFPDMSPHMSYAQLRCVTLSSMQIIVRKICPVGRHHNETELSKFLNLCGEIFNFNTLPETVLLLLSANCYVSFLT